MFTPNRHGIIIRCQLCRDITATAATVTPHIQHMAAMEK